MATADYYVYVYIDPRNYEEFYYGKGKGARRFAHLSDHSESTKTERIRAIQSEGLLPIVRTVASGLTNDEAHLVETTLIWKLGRGLTNRNAGRHVAKFRPPNTLHRELPRFDFANDVYLVNVGEGPHRRWSDCMRLGFLSAGQGKKWRDQILGLAPGDVVVAYVKRHGYVGVGRVECSATGFRDYLHVDKPLTQHHLEAPRMWENADDPEMCEYIVSVKWIKCVDLPDAKWQPRAGLYTTQLIRASLANQPLTRAFIDREFGVRLADLIR